MKFEANIPPNLDSVANQWRDYYKNIPVNLHSNVAEHIPGTVSLYKLDIQFMREYDHTTFFYVGQTTRPKDRASEHKSELVRCKTTTRTGKSVLYNPDYYVGIKSVNLTYTVLRSGLDINQAREEEKALSADLKRLHGDKVITNPKGKKKD